MHVHVNTNCPLVYCSDQITWVVCGHDYDDMVVICPLNINHQDPSDNYFCLRTHEFS